MVLIYGLIWFEAIKIVHYKEKVRCPCGKGFIFKNRIKTVYVKRKDVTTDRHIIGSEKDFKRFLETAADDKSRLRYHAAIIATWKK